MIDGPPQGRRLHLFTYLILINSILIGVLQKRSNQFDLAVVELEHLFMQPLSKH